MAVPFGIWRYPVEMVDGQRQVFTRFRQSSSALGLRGRLQICVSRTVVSLGLFVVGCHQPPVRITDAFDERVGNFRVQSAPDAWRRQFSGHLSQQFVAEPLAVGAPRLEHECVLEFVYHVVDFVLIQCHCRQQQTPVNLASDHRGRLDNRHYVRCRA